MGLVGRGIYKKKKGWLQKTKTLGPLPPKLKVKQLVPQRRNSPNVYIRPSKDHLDLAFTRDEQVFFQTKPNAEMPTRHVMVLRPKTAEMTPVEQIQPKSEVALPRKLQLKSMDDHQEGEGGYRFVKVNSALNLGVDAALDHQRESPECNGRPQLVTGAEERRGLAVAEMMSCRKCGFHTDKKKLYTEIPESRRGRRTAVPNMAFQVGLHNTGIATAGARRLLSAMDTAVPSRTGLQNSANKFGDIMTIENTQDMAEKRKIVKDIQELQGYERESAVAVEIDRQYNIICLQHTACT